jgi:uncharacterized phage protein gp47/JayE
MLDARDQNALLAQLLGDVPGFVTDWRPQPLEAGAALLNVYARYLEILGEGLNQLPARSLLSFLETFGTSLLPAQSARVPLTFQLLPNSPNEVVLPAQSTVAAKLPPPPPSVLGTASTADANSAPLFFTTETVSLSGANLTALYSIDPNNDLFTDHSATVVSGFTAFDNQTQVPHVLYLGHDKYFALAGSAEIVLSFTMEGSALAQGRKLILAWDYLSADGWLPLTITNDTTARFTQDGQVTLHKEIGPDSKQDSIGGQQSFWIRARVSSDPPRTTILALSCLQIVLDKVPNWTANDPILRNGTPHSSVGSVQGSTVILLQPAFFAVGDVVSVPLKDTATVTQADATSLSVDASYQFLPGDVVTVDGEATATALQVFSGLIELDVPLAAADVGVRLFLADAIAPLAPEGVDSLGPLPRVDVINAKVGFDKDGLQADSAYQDSVPLDIGNRFYPFGKQPLPFATFYISSTEVFKRAGARAQITFTGAGVVAAGSAKLSWEYFDGTVWSSLAGLYNLLDSTLNLTQNGAVSFICPPDWAQSEVNGDKNYWLRACLVTGDYGHPLQLSVTVDSSGKATITSDPSTLAPPVIAAITLSYTYYTVAQLLDHCLTYNNFYLIDNTQDARWPRRPFTPFAPVDDRQTALHLGFSAQLPSGLVSLYVDLVANEERVATTSPFVWEYLSADGWNELVVLDETLGFATSGMIQWIGPDDAIGADGLGGVLYRYRARLKDDETITATTINAIWTNSVWGAQGEQVQNLTLGDSSGNPYQSFIFPANLVPVLPGEVIEVREWTGRGDDWQSAVQDAAPQALRFETDPVTNEALAVWVRWRPVDELFRAGGADRVYTLERATGLARFGDDVQGRIPAAGGRITASYTTGGGIEGNVPPNTITQLRTGVAYLQGVTNRLPATGGGAMESAAEVAARGPQRLRHRLRSIAASDYEWLAREASPDLARVRCLPLTGNEGYPQPGWVSLLIAPQSNAPMPQTSAELERRVREFIAQYCPATVAARILIASPSYVPIDVVATLVPLIASDAARIEQAAKSALDLFLHPLNGGFDGNGWQLGDPVYLSQIATVLEGIDGVDMCSDLRLVSNDASYGDFVPVPSNGLVAAGNHSLKLVAEAILSAAGAGAS